MSTRTDFPYELQLTFYLKRKEDKEDVYSLDGVESRIVLPFHEVSMTAYCTWSCTYFYRGEFPFSEEEFLSALTYQPDVHSLSLSDEFAMKVDDDDVIMVTVAWEPPVLVYPRAVVSWVDAAWKPQPITGKMVPTVGLDINFNVSAFSPKSPKSSKEVFYMWKLDVTIPFQYNFVTPSLDSETERVLKESLKETLEREGNDPDLLRCLKKHLWWLGMSAISQLEMSDVGIEIQTALQRVVSEDLYTHDVQFVGVEKIDMWSLSHFEVVREGIHNVILMDEIDVSKVHKLNTNVTAVLVLKSVFDRLGSGALPKTYSLIQHDPSVLEKITVSLHLSE